MKNEMLALILAGGQGTRLGKLTQSIAKPAVQFGGRYRIIDFGLSNCANSGINNVGVITQYQPLALNNHIGNGSSWGLDGVNSGVSILQPYSASEGNRWFEGTSHAIYQNIDYIDSINPEYVLILSGDHIYKMDYDDMLQAHKDNNASLTVAVLDVPLKEASRFGIMNTDANNRIVEFEEKPENPKSTKASMGIYIFDWKRLRNMLVSAEKSAVDMSDFGKNVIPAYLETGESVYAYEFEGYWKDVGTIDSLWDANMDMLSPDNGIDPYDTEWPIYARTPIRPPHFMGMDAKVDHSMVTSGCEVYGTVENSVLFHSVTVEEGAVVRYSILMPGTVVKKGAVVEYAIVAEESVIGENARVGASPDGSEDWGVAVIAQHLNIGPSAVVSPKAMITRNVKGGGVK